MTRKHQRIAVLTSGGDSPGMNACLRAVVRNGLYRGVEIYGVRKGFQGLIEGWFERLTSYSVADIINRGGTFLGSARCEEFKTEQGQQKAISQLESHGCDGLIVIGGDGSFRGAWDLHQKGVAVVGIPATIDNDIWGTYMTIGFDTAVNTVVDALNKLRDTASAHNRCIVVETMGRNSGWIALTAGIAGGADVILVPEIPWTYEEVIEEVQRGFELQKSFSMIVVAEGAAQAGEVAERLRQAEVVENVRVTVLGYIQRGGAPTAYDRILASRLGAAAVDYMLAGEPTGVMLGIQQSQIKPTSLREATTHRRQLDSNLYQLGKILAM